LLDLTRGFNKIQAVIVVFINARGDSENIGVKNNVFGRKAKLFSQNFIGTFTNINPPNMVTGAIDDAVAKGVAVMCFDSDAAASKRFAYFGVDDIETGQATMNALAKVMGEKGVVAILAGNQNAPNLQKRVQGVREAAKAYPGIIIKNVYFHVETPEDAANKVIQVMKANTDITGWAMIGGWPLFTDALLTNWDPNVKIVAVDALPADRRAELIPLIRAASIGPITSETLREMGIPIAITASDSTIPNLVENG
jgi:hypothetical protein